MVVLFLDLRGTWRDVGLTHKSALLSKPVRLYWTSCRIPTLPALSALINSCEPVRLVYLVLIKLAAYVSFTGLICSEELSAYCGGE